MSKHDDEPKLPDVSYIQELAKVFKDFELDELEVEAGERRILLRRADVAAPTYTAAPPAYVTVPSGPPLSVATPAPSGSGTAPAVEDGEFITSPFVGTFYSAPRPDTEPFAVAGTRLAKGQTVCIIEAMKLFNEIEAEFACEVLDVLVKNGQPVEFGAKLLKVRRS
jgi:acetyl-CoA carboxylase biotin carboxyl carrier protein